MPIPVAELVEGRRCIDGLDPPTSVILLKRERTTLVVGRAQSGRRTKAQGVNTGV